MIKSELFVIVVSKQQPLLAACRLSLNERGDLC